MWSARGGKPTLGVDIACTKIAVDLQNIRRGSLDTCINDSLNSLRDSSGVDTAFVWLFSADGTTIEEVYAAHGALAQCRVEAWRSVDAGDLSRGSRAASNTCGSPRSATPPRRAGTSWSKPSASPSCPSARCC